MRYPFSKKARTPALPPPAAGQGARADLASFLDALLLQAWHRERGPRPGPAILPDCATLRALLNHPRHAHLRVLLVPSPELARFILDWLKAADPAPTPAEASRRFCEFFQAIQRFLGASDRDLSLLLHIAPATVWQWATGALAPHPLAREAILFKLAKVAQKSYPLSAPAS
jgi:hypothetical protein